jgi:hypothetical protein
MTPRILERITLMARPSPTLAIASIVFNSSDSAEPGVGDRVR